MPEHQVNQLQFVIPLLVVIPLLYFRLRRLSQPQPLKLGRLWIRPAFILAAALAVLFVHQPGNPGVLQMNALEWAGLALAAVLGAVGGWYWGRTMAIHVHPENGTLMARSGVAAIAVLLALVAMKLGLRPALAAEGQALHLDALLITDASIVFSAALFTARSVEIWLRARRVMQANAG